MPCDCESNGPIEDLAALLDGAYTADQVSPEVRGLAGLARVVSDSQSLPTVSITASGREAMRARVMANIGHMGTAADNGW